MADNPTEKLAIEASARALWRGAGQVVHASQALPTWDHLPPDIVDHYRRMAETAVSVYLDALPPARAV